jgi:LmbE family N-acetylglucosaminyl deacetylase
MRTAVTVLIALAAACGDNIAVRVLEQTHDLVVVAHQDDDMLFMQPDLFDIVTQRRPVTVLYVTAGDAGAGLPFVMARRRALQNAYGTVAGSIAWRCGLVELADHMMLKCSLADRPVTLVFLHYPDGGVVGEAPGSLLHLWEGTITEATTVEDVPATYDRASLITAVAAIIDETRPEIIRTLEVSGTHGDDHADHMIVGALTQLALAQATGEAQLLSYRGYNINYEPRNLDEQVYEQTSLFMRAYLACMISCGGVCGESPCPTVPDQRYVEFLHRRYVVAMRDAPLSGALSSSAGCIGLEDEDLEVGSCAAAPDIRLADAGLIKLGDDCLEVQHDSTLALGACDPDPHRFFQLDQEGHLFSGVAPKPAPDMLYDHSTCIFAESGALRAGLCGEHREQTWQVVP